MNRIAHLSDLHFGAHDQALVEAVEQRIDQLGPDAIVISGDFTQRARTEQFQDACAFLERLKDRGHEVIGVPGNHDIPLYDVLRRFLSPLTRYRRFIDDQLCPCHELSGALLLGINTARSLTFSDGRINQEQVDFIRESFAKADPGKVKVLITHHPLFALPVSSEGLLGKPVGRQRMALDAVAAAGVDLLLAGHNHRASAHRARELVAEAGPALVVQAGTATSTRLRDEEQSFNLIEIDGESVAISVQQWRPGGFVAADADRFVRRDGQWESWSGEQLTEASEAGEA